MPTTHNNHYVPQATLRRWVDADGRVNTYALLVASTTVRLWVRRSPKTIASELDFYSRFSASRDEDEFETWITRSYEEPGQESIEKLLRNAYMQPSDWARISLFVAAQQLRTPLSFLEFSERWPKLAQESLEDSVKKLEQRVAESKQTGIPIQHVPKEDFLTGTMRIVKHITADHGKAALGVEIASMRSLWMADVRRLLQSNARVITETRWQVVVPAAYEDWLLTDHPTLNVIYEGPGQYDFKAGWGQRRANFIMPISPRAALFAEIGQRKTGRFDATPELTTLIHRMQAERAFRAIFSRGEPAWVERVRPRTVDMQQANGEREMWKRWNPEQARTEAEFDSEVAKTPPDP